MPLWAPRFGAAATAPVSASAVFAVAVAFLLLFVSRRAASGWIVPDVRRRHHQQQQRQRQQRSYRHHRNPSPLALLPTAHTASAAYRFCRRRHNNNNKGQSRSHLTLCLAADGGNSGADETHPPPPSAAPPPGIRRRKKRLPIRRQGPAEDAGAMGKEEKDARSGNGIQNGDAHREEVPEEDPSFLTASRFDDLGDGVLHPATRRAVAERLGLSQMTSIQVESFEPILRGQSVLGRSKTGTGKTLAFLVPVVERLVAAANGGGNDDGTRALSLLSPSSVGCLIVAPTRELAIQIADEAEALVSFHRNVKVQCMYGGTKIRRDVNQLSKSVPAILVATPGRLVDHLLLHKTRVHGGRLFSDALSSTPIAVFDEADRLVEGFRRELKQILSFLPRPEKRQTLCFSATLPRRLEKQLQSVLLPTQNYVRVDCVDQQLEPKRLSTSPPPSSANTAALQQQVNARVDQSFVALPSMDLYVPALVELVRLAVKESPNRYKVVVFFPTARLVRFFANIFAAIADSGTKADVDSAIGGVPIFEMHSRLSQSARGRTRSQFVRARNGVMLTSDVSARGIDYPDVSLVIQYGMPFSSELYLHRLGRTARAGKRGRGLLVLLPFEEERAARVLVSRFGLAEDVEAKRALCAETVRDPVEPVKSLACSGQSALTSSFEAAFLSFIAYYAEYADRSVKGEDIQYAAETLVRAAGAVKLPPLSTALARRLALRET